MPTKLSIIIGIITHLVMTTAVKASNNNTEFDVCENESCQMTAQMILENMDQSFYPCDDFYQFACGNYMKNSTSPESQSKTLLHQINAKILERLRLSFEKNIDESDPEYYKKLLPYYKTCMDEDLIDKNSEREILELMKSLGGWPVLERSWDETNFDWRETMYNFRDVGLRTSFITAEYSSLIANYRVKSIVLHQTNLYLSPEKLSKGLVDENVRSYLNYMVDLAVVLGANRVRARRELSLSLNFEISIAQYRTSHVFNQSPTSEAYPMTIQELDDFCPDIPWLEYLTKTLKPPTPLSNSSIIIVNKALDFFESYCKLLTTTPKRTLANYAFWTVVAEFASQLGPEIRQIRRKFISEFEEDSRGVAETPRWIECTKLTKQRMNLATGSLFVREYFNETVKQKAMDIVEHILHSFRNSLENVQWMGDGTRKAAIEKIEAMRALIAYPEELIDTNKLDNLYKNVTANRSSFLKYQLSLNLFHANFASEGYNEPVDMLDWTGLFGDVATANAYYIHLDNAFVLMAGILEGFFNYANPNYVNFGGIGSIIGHEITHGIDMFGRLFDKRGNLNNWWDNETVTEFQRISHCFSNKYSLYGYLKNFRLFHGVAGLGLLVHETADNPEPFYDTTDCKIDLTENRLNLYTIHGTVMRDHFGM